MTTRRVSCTEEKGRLECFVEVYHSDISFGFEQKIHALTAHHVLPWVTEPVLEMGCGNGTWTRILLTKVAQLEVVDASAALLQQLTREHGDCVTCHESLFEEFSPVRRYQTVLLAGTLHHVQDPVAVLKRIEGWLTPSGQVLIVVPNAHSLHRRLGKKMGLIQDLTEISPLGKKQGHRRVYAPDTLRRDVMASGLEGVAEEGLFLKCLPNDAMEGLADEVLRGLLALALELPLDYATLLFLRCRARPTAGAHQDGTP